MYRYQNIRVREILVQLTLQGLIYRVHINHSECFLKFRFHLLPRFYSFRFPILFPLIFRRRLEVIVGPSTILNYLKASNRFRLPGWLPNKISSTRLITVKDSLYVLFNYREKSLFEGTFMCYAEVITLEIGFQSKKIWWMMFFYRFTLFLFLILCRLSIFVRSLSLSLC